MRRDFSMIALVFFLTRCFFNLYTFNHLYRLLLPIGIIFLFLLFLKLLKIDLFQYKLFNLLYLPVMIMTFIIVLTNTTVFINNNYFKYENYFVIVISLLLMSYFLGKGKIKTISSISEIFMIFFIFSSLIIYVGLISMIQKQYYHDFLKFNYYSLSLLPYLIVFIFLYLKNNNLVIGYFLGVISVFIDTILLVGSLGTKLILEYKFPGISVLKSLNFFHFINHLDKLLSFIYLFEYTITLALIFNIIKEITKKLRLAFHRST